MLLLSSNAESIPVPANDSHQKGGQNEEVNLRPDSVCTGDMHNVQFQVVQRTASTLSSYATINQGLVDTGWKDTVLVWPGERVKIAMMFGPHAGMYMYHCHILEHEDMTMMRNYMIMDHTMPM